MILFRVVHDIAARLADLLARPYRVEHDVSDRAAELLTELAGLHEPRLVFTRLSIPHEGLILSGAILDMNVQMERAQTVTATVEAKDRRGRPARVEGVTWASSDESVATVAQDSANPLTATIQSADLDITEPRTATITATADAIIGEGEAQLVCVGTVVLAPAQAVVTEMAFGTPSDTASEPTPTPEP
jgi:hypothetical protein